MPTRRKFQLDVDTKRYCNRVDTYRLLNGLPRLQPPDISDIDNFIVGLKDLGVWTNTVCWLMGSKYNVGAGTTLLSIGGAGHYPGTLVNSPTWSNDGLVSDAYGRYVTHMFGRNFGVFPFTSFFVGKFGSAGTVGARYFAGAFPTTATEGGYDFGNTLGNRTSIDTNVRNVNNTNSSRVIVGTAPLDLFNTVIVTRNNNVVGVSINGVFKSSASTLSSGVSLSRTSDVGYLLNRQYLASLTPYNLLTMPFAAYISGTAASTSMTSSLHSLYKSSIGKTLSLP